MAKKKTDVKKNEITLPQSLRQDSVRDFVNYWYRFHKEVIDSPDNKILSPYSGLFTKYKIKPTMANFMDWLSKQL